MLGARESLVSRCKNQIISLYYVTCYPTNLLFVSACLGICVVNEEVDKIQSKRVLLKVMPTSVSTTLPVCSIITDT